MCMAVCAAAALAVAGGCKTSTAAGTAATAADAGTPDGGSSQGREVANAAADAGTAAAGAVAGAATTAAEAAQAAAREAAAAPKTPEDGGTAAADGGVPDAGGSAAEAPLSDAQIAAVAVTANKVDIEAGQVASRKSRNAKVRRFASDMIRDHGSANEQAVALAKKLAIEPEENPVSRAIAQDGQDNLARLNALKGKAFDRAYAEHEVVYHQQVLGALDEKLIPGARNPELKSLLVTVREVVAAHFGHAKELLDATSR